MTVIQRFTIGLDMNTITNTIYHRQSNRQQLHNLLNRNKDWPLLVYSVGVGKLNVMEKLLAVIAIVDVKNVYTQLNQEGEV